MKIVVWLNLTMIAMFAVMIFFITQRDLLAWSGEDLLQAPLAADGRINDDTGNARQQRPSLALSRYNFAVCCWEDFRTGSGRIYVQRFGQRGLKYQNNFQVTPFNAAADQWLPDIAVDDLGHFVVVWEERGDSVNVYARLYAANAVPLTEIIRVNQRVNPSATSAYARVAMNNKGDFVVTWVSRKTDIAGDVYAQRFNSGGEKIGTNFLVPSATAGPQTRPDVAMNASGRFVVVWEDGREVHQPSREYQIYAHVYDSSGRALGADFKVSRHPAGAVMPVDPAVAIKPNNQFFVCWSYGNPAGNPAVIYGHLFDANNSTIRDDWVLSSLGDFEPVGPNFRPKVCSTPLGYAVGRMGQQQRQRQRHLSEEFRPDRRTTGQLCGHE